MTDPIKHYLNRIERLLQLDKATRQRIMKELASDIQARQETGAAPDAIIAEMGTPEEVAAGFNAAFADHAAPRKNPLRWLVLLAAGVPLSELAILQLFRRFTGTESGSVGIIGGADGPTAIFVTVSSPGTSICQDLSALFALLALFLVMQWPRSAAKPLSRTGRWLPLALSLAAAVLWLVCLLLGGFDLNALLCGLLAAVSVSLALRRVKR